MFVFNPIRKSVLNFDIGQTGQTGGQQYSDASHYELSDYSLVINSSNDACRKLTWLLKNSEDFAYARNSSLVTFPSSLANVVTL